MLQRLDGFLDGIARQWRTEDRDKLSVLVLWRYNHLNPFTGRPPPFRNIEVIGLSFHKSKGLEADYTILLDISEGDYGVPSRIEGDELLGLVVAEPEKFAYAEERRLFYVALTRAVRGVYILTDRSRPSVFIRELCEIAGDGVRFETVDGEEVETCPTCRIGHRVQRRVKSGRQFDGCSQYPDCKNTDWPKVA